MKPTTTSAKAAGSPLGQMDPLEAWKPWKTDEKSPWGLKWAGHLLRRAAFLPSWEELQQAIKQGPEATLERLFAGGAGQADFDEAVSQASKGLARNAQISTLGEYQAVWVYRLTRAPHPLRERMTLFWHNLFATSVAKVRRPDLMLQQNEVLRRHALLKFGPFLLEMSKDPAMLIWLDSNSNVKGKANENFARELMELFSLGVGNYTEKDVQEAARAFTGWHTAGGQFLFNKAQHDFGAKTVLGQTGDWDGGDIVRIVLEQPACARFLVRKLFRQFISETVSPPDRLLEPLAEQLRKTDYDIGPVVRTMLSSRLFFSKHAYRQRIKSPVEFIVGLARSLAGDVQPQDLADAFDGLGQELFAPPSVKGWDGGKAWLNSATLLARHNLAWTIVGGEDERFRQAVNPASLARKHGGDDYAKQLNFLLDLFLNGDVAPPARLKLLKYLEDGKPKDANLDKRLRETAHTILTMPEYQLA